MRSCVSQGVRIDTPFGAFNPELSFVKTASLRAMEKQRTIVGTMRVNSPHVWLSSTQSGAKSKMIRVNKCQDSVQKSGHKAAHQISITTSKDLRKSKNRLSVDTRSKGRTSCAEISSESETKRSEPKGVDSVATNEKRLHSSSNMNSSADVDGSYSDSSNPSSSLEENFQGYPSWLRSIFSSSPYDASIAALAIPAVLALAADPLLQVVDTIFVGQAGSDALAALGVNSALFTFSFVIFNFLATATTPLVATALSSGDHEKAGRVTSQALVIAAVLGCSLAFGLHSFAEPALSLMGADESASPSMFGLAKDFLLIRAAAAPAALLVTVGQGVFRGLQDMKTPLNITLLANGVNLSLDIILITGLGLGVKGAATATLVAEWTAAVSFLALIWNRKDQLGGSSAILSGFAAPSMAEAIKDAVPFLSAGGAVLLRTTALLGTKTLASVTATRLGPVSIASHQIVMQLWLLSSFAIDSLAVAGQSLVAVELGHKNLKEARNVSNRLLQLGLAVGVTLALALAAVSPWIPSVFNADVKVESAVWEILPLAIGLLPLNAVVYVLDGILVGASDFKWMAKAMFFTAVAAAGLLFAVEPLDAGLLGVWIALAMLMSGRLGTLLWRYNSQNGPLPDKSPKI